MALVCISAVSQLGLTVMQEKECKGWLWANHTQDKLGRGQQVVTWGNKGVLEEEQDQTLSGWDIAKKAGIKMDIIYKHEQHND